MKSCSQHKPNRFLSRYIQCFFLLEQGSPPDSTHFQRITPDGCAEINFNLCSPMKRMESTGRTFVQDDFYLIRRVSQHYFVQQPTSVQMFGIRFYPWGLRPFLPVKVSEITDTFLTPEEVFGSRSRILQEKIYGSANKKEMIANAEAYFSEELYNASSDDVVVSDAMQRIIAAKGTIDLDNLTTRYGLTSRRIQQRFSDFAGCGPKMFARLVRFRFALRRLHTIALNAKLTDVAYDSGYYDQPHFIRDFKLFAGISPYKYLSQDHTLNRMMSGH